MSAHPSNTPGNAKRSTKIISDTDYEDTIMNLKDKSLLEERNSNLESQEKKSLIRMKIDDKKGNLPSDECNVNQNSINKINEESFSKENSSNLKFAEYNKINNYDKEKEEDERKIKGIEENKFAFDDVYFGKSKSFSNKNYNKEELFLSKEDSLKYSNSMKLVNEYENKNFNFDNNINDNVNSKITDDDYKSNKSDCEEDDFNDFIIDDTIQIESKNLQKIRSNLNSLCLIGARLFWDFRLTNNPKTDIKITGSKSQITKIKAEINKIISSGNQK